MMCAAWATALIPIRNRKGEVVANAVVDREDLEALSAFRWNLNGNGYAIRHGRRPDGRWTTVLMHRQILGLGPGDKREGDHRNLVKLDNRRSNLRVVSRSEQKQNVPSYRTAGRTSSHRGVSLEAWSGKWLAQVSVGGRRVLYRSFPSEAEAARAAREARLRFMTHSVEATA